jgi:hypothetical protein
LNASISRRRVGFTRCTAPSSVCRREKVTDPEGAFALSDAHFLEGYRAECAIAGVEPLPADDLAAIANAILTGAVAGAAMLH